MKKTLLLILLMPLLTISQNKPDWDYDMNRPIGAFFPSYFPMATNKYIASQNTFYEYNWVSNNLQRLITKNLRLVRNSDENNKGNYIINSYNTSSGTVIDRLYIKYNIFTMYGMYVVSSIEVTGSKAQVIKLFIYLYGNELQSGSLKNGFIKTFAQDNAVYSIVNGVSSIKITNGVYKNQIQFKYDFEKLKEQFKTDLMLAKLDEEQKRLENEEYIKKRNAQFKADSIARKEEYKQAMIEVAERERTKPTTTINVYYFTKSSNKLKFKNQPSGDIEQLITEKISGYKKGNYTAHITTVTTLENKTYKIVINPTDKVF